jgi:hypothetical protein
MELWIESLSRRGKTGPDLASKQLKCRARRTKRAARCGKDALTLLSFSHDIVNGLAIGLGIP